RRRDLARRKLSILYLRHEQRRLARWYLHPKPRGPAMNYMIDHSVWSLAEKIKDKTGKPNWRWIADLISEYLSVEMDAKKALKAYNRYDRLRGDYKRFAQAVEQENPWVREIPSSSIPPAALILRSFRRRENICGRFQP